MVETIRRWFLPEQLRVCPGGRAWSLAFRTLHLTAFGVFLGGHAFQVEAETLLPSLWGTILSGLGLIALEVYREGLYWFVLGKGILVLIKLAVLLLLPVFWEARVVLLFLVVGIASVGSHMPACYRHYSLVHRRVIEPGPAPFAPDRLLR